MEHETGQCHVDKGPDTTGKVSERNLFVLLLGQEADNEDDHASDKTEEHTVGDHDARLEILHSLRNARKRSTINQRQNREDDRACNRALHVDEL